MGDTRDAGRPRMSPQWEMVFARFDDLARQVAMIETARIQDGRENRAEFQDLRDHIQRTREEVAHQATMTAEKLEGADAALLSALESIGTRVENLEGTRKTDVREVLNESAPGAVAQAVRQAPGAAWHGLSWPSKTGAIVGGLTIIGTLLAGIADGAPKLATLAWKVITALADKPAA